MKKCIFCEIIKREASGFILDENEDIIVSLALEGHPLVVTKKHIANIYSLDDRTGAAVMKAAIKVSNAVKKSLQCEGISLVQANEPAAHQDVFPFHLHIKPRWINDAVTLNWDTTVVTPGALKEMQDKIKKAL
ncbi:MAG: HIT domain-containing protein [Candidatus Levybacteria bacterium]|nr:HIT domain-containing protein [Candidatus Levybacteria bacterium]